MKEMLAVNGMLLLVVWLTDNALCQDANAQQDDATAALNGALSKASSPQAMLSVFVWLRITFSACFGTSLATESC